MTYDKVPQELKDRRQWVGWKLETRRGKPTKVPFTRPGVLAKSTDPTTWVTFDQALEMGDIGFVLSADDPYVGIDLDHCSYHPDAHSLVKQLGGYAEWSPSGNGLHVIVKGVWDHTRNRTAKVEWGGGLEVYDRGRYLTVTGNALHEVVAIPEVDLTWLKERYLPARTFRSASYAGPTQTLDDGRLIRRASRIKKFGKLWIGDTSDYPSASEADLALCNLLAFFTRNPDQIDRVFRQSGLMRDKWNERRGAKTYGQMRVDLVLGVDREPEEPKESFTWDTFGKAFDWSSFTKKKTPRGPKLETALDELAAAFDGEWIEEPAWVLLALKEKDVQHFRKLGQAWGMNDCTQIVHRVLEDLAETLYNGHTSVTDDQHQEDA